MGVLQGAGEVGRAGAGPGIGVSSSSKRPLGNLPSWSVCSRDANTKNIFTPGEPKISVFSQKITMAARYEPIHRGRYISCATSFRAARQ